MIDMQLLTGILVAVGLIVVAAIALSVGIFAVASAAKPGRGPHGGIRRDLPGQPQPDADNDRELMLV
jgi:hypothetical protein